MSSQLSYMFGGADAVPQKVQHRPPPTPGQNGAMLTENEIVHMNLADLRIQCRAHGVSPAGSRENLQERLCCALSSGESQERMPLIKMAIQPGPGDMYDQQPHEDEYQPYAEPPPHYDPYNEDPHSYLPSDGSHLYGKEPYYPDVPPEEAQAEILSRKPSQSLNSCGVAHMFGKDTPIQDARPSKRMVVADMDDKHSVAAGAARRKDRDVPPNPRDAGKIGWMNSQGASDALHYANDGQIGLDAVPPNARDAEKIGWLNSHGVSDALHYANDGQMPCPNRGAPPPLDVDPSHYAPHYYEQPSPTPRRPSSTTPYAEEERMPHKSDLTPIDEDTKSMIKALSLADLRAMLRKRGVNPAGSRQVLQERLEDYLIGDNLDCDFKPPPTPEGDQSAPRGPPSFQPPSSVTSSPKAGARPPGRAGHQSGLGYLFGGA